MRNLVRAYRGRKGELIKANDGVTFSVPRGQVFGLFGTNGAGKTTLVLQLLGLLRPTSGWVRVNGIDVLRDPEMAKSTMGFLPQTALSMKMLEVRRALHYTGRLRGQSETDARRQTDELIEELSLGPYADRQVGRLSGGLTRLVNFGMTMMGRPEMIVLDEPTNELDPHNRRQIWDIIERRSALEGTTIVLVTHNVLEAEKAVHRVAVMHGGRITAMGTPGELKEQMGAQARLELFVREGDSLTEEEIARLSTVGQVSQGNRSGSYLIAAEPDRMQALLHVLVSDVGVGRVDDFRFARPTLEDVYLSLNLKQDADTPAANGQVTTEAKRGAQDPEALPSASDPAPESAEMAPAVAGSDRRLTTVPLPRELALPAPGPPASHRTRTRALPVLARPETAVETAAESAADPAPEPVLELVPKSAPTPTSVPDPASAPAPAKPTGPRSGKHRRVRVRLPFRARLARFGTSFKYLWFEHMLNIRTTWHIHMVFGIVMPLAMVFGFSRIGSGLTDNQSLYYIASGSGVFTIAALGTSAIAQRMGDIKAEGLMLYYASLPISKVAFVTAFIASRLLLIAPGLVTSLVSVRLMYDLQLTLSPLLLIVYPVTTLPLAAMGLVIGSLIDRTELIALVANVLNFILLLGAPLIIPSQALPLPLRALSYVMPTTYGADAIRRSVSDTVDTTFAIDIGVLAVMTVLALGLANRMLRWRAG
ncbi:ABC transporter ATP-binding protein/permease [Streptomyces coffeae]|uniref:ABC transporter ATP-binding protein/permease n=1 Tax=Streptomyces coffeae TaxID=621382 RepID=UPI0027DDB4F5|nr:ATP-binding cassette domain-containing protein [Streptomyces coffeae]